MPAVALKQCKAKQNKGTGNASINAHQITQKLWTVCKGFIHISQSSMRLVIEVWIERKRTFCLLDLDGLDVGIVVVDVEHITVVGLVANRWTMFPLAAGFLQTHTRYYFLPLLFSQPAYFFQRFPLQVRSDPPNLSKRRIFWDCRMQISFYRPDALPATNSIKALKVTNTCTYTSGCSDESKAPHSMPLLDGSLARPLQCTCSLSIFQVNLG